LKLNDEANNANEHNVVKNTKWQDPDQLAIPIYNFCFRVVSKFVVHDFQNILFVNIFMNKTVPFHYVCDY